MQTRRRFLGSAAALGAALAAPSLAQGTPRVVVVGGGAGGATAALHLARQAAGALDVTLVEPNPIYTTCFFSNHYIGGLRSLDSLQHGYGGLAAAGVTLVPDRAIGVDRLARTVTLAGGAVLPYDRLVLSPGIDFVPDSVPGWSPAMAEIMPNGYRAGPEITLLKAQIESMREGGTFCIVTPPDPYRCPPGPYERISMIAHVLKQRNPTARILILDPKPKYSKQALFEEGWQNHYTGMIERIGPDMGGDLIEVRPQTMEVVIDGEAEPVDVCNVIPAQVAGRIVAEAGLTDDSGWAPVRPEDMTSRLDDSVHVLGDAALQGDMPKSGFAANSQARVAVQAILGALTGRAVPPAEYASICWSVLAPGDSVKVGAVYAPQDDKISSVHGFISQMNEDAETRQATYAEGMGWYDNATADMFG
ncbi:NAD(P)/FAD-dependent oxidoreductase [Frigidibacter sp. ROC022]|uniref:NAD(P)/FAD-dependent oxidoreductase n=1 Tax=Frigidibacter sp. ROC022 TaxID=2971796 RepID=UPI00215ABE42|nr:NAD(P)/FAD-dependent oxidoreductase [Frigidibacter sp. ROC022]MCR8726197.1 NAD(P)/FAD-dependent oxidoreductase [Frigidibacter sp. ROC022]